MVFHLRLASKLHASLLIANKATNLIVLVSSLPFDWLVIRRFVVVVTVAGRTLEVGADTGSSVMLAEMTTVCDKDS